jgi:hypothetical protein
MHSTGKGRSDYLCSASVVCTPLTSLCMNFMQYKECMHATDLGRSASYIQYKECMHTTGKGCSASLCSTSVVCTPLTEVSVRLYAVQGAALSLVCSRGLIQALMLNIGM